MKRRQGRSYAYLTASFLISCDPTVIFSLTSAISVFRTCWCTEAAEGHPCIYRMEGLSSTPAGIIMLPVAMGTNCFLRCGSERYCAGEEHEQSENHRKLSLYRFLSFRRCANGENTESIRPFCPQIFAHFLRVLWMKDARKAVSTRQHRVSRILAEKRRVFEKNARTKAR